MEAVAERLVDHDPRKEEDEGEAGVRGGPPGDLYVEIPEISDHYGITHGKLNQAYLYGNSIFKYYDGPGEGLGLLALTLEHNFGARIDHSAAVNLQTFVRIVDALGGIDISLPAVIDGRVRNSTDSNRYFPAGPQHLNGYRAMLLARMRPNGDLARSHTQDLILQALTANLARGEQSLVFLNRRGYAPTLYCTVCAWVSPCPRCSARLVLHRSGQRLKCHHCGHEARIPTACPSCGNADLKALGQGTQRLEETLTAALPQARIRRIDRDTMRPRAWAELGEDLRSGQVDILVGT
ncbi:LCP family protein, partial [uncultured Brevundimonas sp.]|uniref:LCP family protein n=1 Tax=uncultured Brevundimonas sp. TaxID=213418 RepID=UPI00262978ED